MAVSSQMFSADIDWTAFILAIAIVELTPGPNMGWLAALSAQSGRRIGLMAVAGITLGLFIQLLAATTGLSAALASAPFLYEVLRWAGVLFMLYLAWEAFTNTGSTSALSVSARASLTRGLITNVLNPKALVFYLLIVGQFADPLAGSIWQQILILGLMHLGFSILVHSMIVLLGARLGAHLDQWRTSLPARLTFALLLVGVAVWIAVSTTNPI